METIYFRKMNIILLLGKETFEIKMWYCLKDYVAEVKTEIWGNKIKFPTSIK